MRTRTIVILLAIAAYLYFQEIQQKDEDFYACYKPAYQSLVRQHRADGIQLEADRLTDLCMATKNYVVDDAAVASCSANKIPPCYRKLRPWDAVKSFFNGP